MRILGWLPEGWEVKKIWDLLSKVKRKGKTKKTEYLEKWSYPVINQSREFIAWYIDDEKVVEKEFLPIVIFWDHTRVVKYISFPFAFLSWLNTAFISWKWEITSSLFLYGYKKYRFVKFSLC